MRRENRRDVKEKGDIRDEQKLKFKKKERKGENEGGGEERKMEIERDRLRCTLNR